MNDLTKELNKLIQTCQDMTDVIKKSKYPSQSDSIAMSTFHKKCEDGILNNIDSADDYQLKKMMSYHFKFYTEFNFDKELLSNTIKKIIRDKKIDKII
jgi:hypothetical protein